MKIVPVPLQHPDSRPHPSEAAPAAPGHVTVLLEEAVGALRARQGGVYVDGTFGGGGHTSRLLAQRPPVAMVLAIDADLDAGPRAEEVAARQGNEGRLRIFHANFRDLADVVREAGYDTVDGVLLDLGLSSYQLDEGERGFSFRFDAPLDMRFDQSCGPTAADLVNTLPEAELSRMFWELGEERNSRRIAAAIARERMVSPIESTAQLVSLVERVAGPRRGAGIHPATRTFQALRIAVNGELDALSHALEAAVDVLAPGGRLAVIAFHSLEDRIVKRFVEAESRTCVCPPEQPVCTCDTMPRLRRVGKAIRPAAAEIESNPRSRSAIMRVAERLDRDGLAPDRGIGE